jgi:hypothetical protein
MLQLKVMEVLEEKLLMCFYHQNVLPPPYSFKDMLSQEDTSMW